jgi:ADP-heptose:LPS heptosyltransferase
MRGRYLVRDRAAFIALAGFDLAAAMATRLLGPGETGRIDRLVVGVGGHLGDAIIASSAIARLRAWWPQVELGVVGSSAAGLVFEDHPAVDRFFQLDHWKADRSGAPFLRRLKSYRRMRSTLLPELRAARYDASVDLYPYYPNMSLLFWRAGIPRRVGYTSGGGGPYLTDPLAWAQSRQHVATYHDRLLASLGVPASEASSYDLAEVDGASRRVASELLRSGNINAPFVILHPGTGDARKGWPTARWIALAEALRAEGYEVVVTGVGRSEHAHAERIRLATGAANLVDRTTVSVLRAVMHSAAFVVAVDSAAGHLAAADRVPAAVIMSGMADPEHWRPLSSTVAIAMAPVPCAPCFLSEGCGHMSCVRSVTVSEVLALVHAGARQAP